MTRKDFFIRMLLGSMGECVSAAAWAAGDQPEGSGESCGYKLGRQLARLQAMIDAGVSACPEIGRASGVYRTELEIVSERLDGCEAGEGEDPDNGLGN